MEREVVFVKSYTNLSMLQKEHKVSYFITSSKKSELYGVGIESSGDDGVYEEIAANLYSERKSAEELALFFYENAVCPEHLGAILHDLRVTNYLQ